MGTPGTQGLHWCLSFSAVTSKSTLVQALGLGLGCQAGPHYPSCLQLPLAPCLSSAPGICMAAIPLLPQAHQVLPWLSGSSWWSWKWPGLVLTLWSLPFSQEARAVGPQGAAIGPQAERSAGQPELGAAAANQIIPHQVGLVALAGGSVLSASLAVAVALEVRPQLLPQGSPHFTP